MPSDFAASSRDSSSGAGSPTRALLGVPSQCPLDPLKLDARTLDRLPNAGGVLRRGLRDEPIDYFRREAVEGLAPPAEPSPRRTLQVLEGLGEHASLVVQAPLLALDLLPLLPERLALALASPGADVGLADDEVAQFTLNPADITWVEI